MKKRLLCAFWLVGSAGAALWACFWIFTAVNTVFHAQTYSFRTVKGFAISLVIAGLGIELARQGFKMYQRERNPERPIYMLCRNRVRDFSRWQAVIDSHEQSHRAAGLKLVQTWRSVGDSSNVFFIFEVKDIEKARTFINTPESAAAGEESGVVDGEYHFIEDVEAN